MAHSLGVELLLRRGLASGYQREEKHNDSGGTQQAADADQKNKSQRPHPEQTDGLHQQADNQQHPGQPESFLESNDRRGHWAPFQNFTLFNWPALCTTSWHPLERQETLVGLHRGKQVWIRGVNRALFEGAGAQVAVQAFAVVVGFVEDEWDCGACRNTAHRRGAIR